MYVGVSHMTSLRACNWRQPHWRQRHWRQRHWRQRHWRQRHWRQSDQHRTSLYPLANVIVVDNTIIYCSSPSPIFFYNRFR